MTAYASGPPSAGAVRTALLAAARRGHAAPAALFAACSDPEAFRAEFEKTVEAVRSQGAPVRADTISHRIERWSAAGWIAGGQPGLDSQPLPQCRKPPPRGGGGWHWLPREAGRLPLVLGELEMAVFLALCRHVNWRDDRQGGVRAVFASDESIARELEKDRSNVSRARRSLVARRIYRDATPEETEAVLAEAGKFRRRRPRVQVLIDPECWRLSPHACDDMEDE